MVIKISAGWGGGDGRRCGGLTRNTREARACARRKRSWKLKKNCANKRSWNVHHSENRKAEEEEELATGKGWRVWLRLISAGEVRSSRNNRKWNWTRMKRSSRRTGSWKGTGAGGVMNSMPEMFSWGILFYCIAYLDLECGVMKYWKPWISFFNNFLRPENFKFP